MSHALIARSRDLRKLKESGHAIRISAGNLIVEEVPYLNERQEVAKASLVLPLLLMSGDKTARPPDHVAFWTGDFPHRANGEKLTPLGESPCSHSLSDGTGVTYMFSAKPKDGYEDYEHKVLTYISILGQDARKIDPEATARVWRVDDSRDEDEVFLYMETASARQNTGEMAARLAGEKVAIVGVGGTGSYVLDFVAKTWVSEIHLYDPDPFLQHNAFRAPGAFAHDELEGGPNKAELHTKRYSRMRKGMVVHAVPIDEQNVDELRICQTVFLCIDGSEIKRKILQVCEEEGAVCIDTGMGIYRTDDRLGGILRTTTSAPKQRDHIWEKRRIDMGGGEDGEYERNIQMAELNALNAALAVIRWKKIRGIYADIGREGDSNYAIEVNRIVNRDEVGLEM